MGQEVISTEEKHEYEIVDQSFNIISKGELPTEIQELVFDKLTKDRYIQ